MPANSPQTIPNPAMSPLMPPRDLLAKAIEIRLTRAVAPMTVRVAVISTATKSPIAQKRINCKIIASAAFFSDRCQMSLCLQHIGCGL